MELKAAHTTPGIPWLMQQSVPTSLLFTLPEYKNTVGYESFFIANYSQSSSLQSFLSSCLLPDCSCCSNSSLDLTGGNRGRDSGGFYVHMNIRTEAKEIDLCILQKCSPFTGEGFTSTPESVSTAASLPSVDEARLPGKNQFLKDYLLGTTKLWLITKHIH